ncbi:MAG TPA: hypothetical protein VI754_07060 [Bacteriovoracaceae bacterium]|nr:hypothetical protein [Bacteriovoracaceae bacterium]
MEWIQTENSSNENQTEVLSFEDYMKKFEVEVEKECRPSYQYFLDMLEHFGQDANGHFKLFQRSHPDSPAVFGQYKTQQEIWLNLKNFQEEGLNNKFILLVGPNGSAKSSLVRKFMKGAEEYSNLPEGELFTFSWIFPIDNFVKGTLGLSNNAQSKQVSTYAYLDDKDISAIISSELKDHPILLVPALTRQQMIDKLLSNSKERLISVQKSYLYRGDLSKRNRMIYDALLKNYKGNHGEVLKHIRVERFTISKRYSNSAVTIEPQLHVDARLQQISMDKRLASLPPSLQSLNLFSAQGEVILANRGILEFSDLLKRPLDAFKYLLMTMETGTLNLNGILTELDIFFVGSSNEVHLDAFKQHPDFKSFMGRFNFIKVPYLLDYRDEVRIYDEQVQGLSSKSTFEPHALKTLCLFSVMTRLRKCQANNYAESKKIAPIAGKLTPLDKALYLADKIMPENLDVESRQILLQSYDDIAQEFDSDVVYEGKFGISPRDVKKIIYSLTTSHSNITSVEVIEYLQKFITRKNDFDFLNMTPVGDFHNTSRFITILKDYSLDIFDKELRDSLGLVDNRSYEEYIRRYIENINALIKKEKVKNFITGKYENSDTYLIDEFEKSIGLKENATNFRSHLLSKLGAYALDNPGTTINYSDVFPEIARKLQESFKQEQTEIIRGIANNLVFYEAEITKAEGARDNITTPLSKEGREQINTIITNLTTKHKYSKNGAISLLKYIIKNRY